MLSAIIGVLFLFADQLIKFWTVSHIELNTGIQELLPGILHLTYIKNYGAAFGLFSNAPWLRWVLLGLLVCFTLFILLGVRRGGYLRTGFARFTGLMLLAGLLGNGIDRAIYGYVVDMFELEFINFAIFNLADMLVVVFGILFCISLIAGGIGAADEYEEDEEEPYVRRHHSREEEPQRPRRSASEGQARRSSGSGNSQHPRRPSGSGPSAHRSSGSGQQPRRPSGNGSQPTRRPHAEEEPPRPRRPRPAEAGMSVRPLVTTPAPEAVPEETAAPAPEAVPVETVAPAPEAVPVETAVPAPEAVPEEAAAPAPEVTPVETAVPVQETVPVETVPEADATRPFQPVRVPEAPKAEPGATRPFQPVSAPAAKTGNTQAYQPATKAPETPAAAPGATQVYQPATKPAAKASDEFDLDSILAEFK